MKKTIAILAAAGTLLANGAMIPVSAVNVPDKTETRTFVVIKNTGITVTFLEVNGGEQYHKIFSDAFSIAVDSFYYNDNFCCDPLAVELTANASYGDIIEYNGALLGYTEKAGVNQLFRQCVQDLETDPTGNTWVPVYETDSFTKIGTVFDTPVDTVGTQMVNGEELITVTVADGTVYVVGKDPSQGSVDPNIFYTQDEYEKTDFIPLRTLSEMTAEELYGDFNGDGTVDALDASVILQYSADVGAGAFTGTLKEYAEKE